MSAERLAAGRPAERWTEAWPLGNGRLGSMVFGTPHRSRFQLNDDTCWTGSPASAHGRLSHASVDGPAALARVRSALAAGDVAAATAAEQDLQLGWSQAYQPLADVWVESDGDREPRTLERILDLPTATSTTTWTTPAQSAREVSWVSAPDGVLVIEREVTRGAPFSGRVLLDTPHEDGTVRAGAADATITVRMPSDISREAGSKTEHALHDPAPGAAVTAVVALLLEHDGVSTGALAFAGARRIRIVVATATDFVGMRIAPHGDASRLLAEASARSAAALARGDALHARHVADHRALYDRMSLHLGTSGSASVSTAELLRGAAEDGDERRLAETVFAFGRYLTIAGSRAGSGPLNLQGIWNDKLLPPWRGNYTTNINLQMNYWPTEAVNLAECHEPLLEWLGDLAERSARTARELYGLPGWTVHHNSDIWGFSVPVGDGTFDPVWSMWPMGGAWLCRHLWDRWLFSQDLEELRDRSWPILRGAAAFVLDWLVELDDGTLGTMPSTSPENHFLVGAVRTGLTVSTTADLAMIRDLLTNVVSAAEMLGLDDPLVARAARALSRIPREHITGEGLLAEWYDDSPDAEPHHRHQSHLYGVLPGDAVVPWTEAELCRAAARSLDVRGRDTTGWSLAWRVGLRARLRDAVGAHAALRDFLAPVREPDDPGPSGQAGLYANLFCAHPPFQIDGNFGITAAILEMIVQSHGGRIAILPALPAQWPSGRVRGARVRGGAEIDLDWRHGVPTSLTLRGGIGTVHTVEMRGEVTRVAIGPSGSTDVPIR
ncbi:glycosyl hydrolase family 95 catalytic domain-containing protein [Microbacterium sp. DT81.1]|uniref:glycosyl hydrolase family 95 catalytic domain-containing protein n=1 Tax=Microbacterium sp. DT81.1 TaxID=3393413 RepID=UPI003CEB0AF3